MVVSSSGALAAIGSRPAQDLLVGGMNSAPPKIVADRVEPELEAGHDAEVAATAAHGPEQVGVLGLARRDDAAVGGDDLDRHEGVDGQAVLAGEPADAATQGQAGDADAARVAERGRQAVGRRRDRVLLGAQARPGPRRDDARGRCAGPSWRPGRGRCRPPTCRGRPGCGCRRGPPARGPLASEHRRSARRPPRSAAWTMSAGRRSMLRGCGPGGRRRRPRPRAGSTVPAIPAMKAATSDGCWGSWAGDAGEGHGGRILSGGSPGGGGR